MRFAGKVWRLLVGIKDGLVLILMLLFFLAIYAALSTRPFVGSGQTGALVLDISGTIVEQPAETDPLQLLAGGSALREYRLRDMVGALDAAASDDRVKTVVLDLDVFAGGGRVALSDIAAAIDRVRRAGKPVLAYATGYDDAAYTLAAHASEVWLNPMGAVLIAGPGGTGLYFAELMERLGIEANIFRVGAYKAAVEPFERSDMSPEAREANQALADALWEQWLEDVGRARPKAQAAAYAQRPADRLAAAGGDMARAALAAGLVDRIGDRTAFGARVAELAGVDDEDVPGSFKAIGYDAWVASNPVGEDRSAIGVLTVAGEIVDGVAAPGVAGSATITEALDTAFEEQALKALVVRIDSPGGSVTASEDIRRALLSAKAKDIPVVISMGSVAASGGYWIATAGDTIFAEPETITGSIGVFGIIPTFVGAIDKIGIGADGVGTTPLTSQPNVLRGLSPEVERVMQMGVEHYYRQFIMLVAEARKMPVQRVDQVAQGRVWDGGTARQLGLVDRFGSLDAAIAEAARRANLDPADVEPVHLDTSETWLSRLFMPGGVSAAPRDAFSKLAARPEQQLARAFREAKAILSGPAVQARCLECPATARPLSVAEKQGLSAWLAARLGV